MMFAVEDRELKERKGAGESIGNSDSPTVTAEGKDPDHGKHAMLEGGICE